MFRFLNIIAVAVLMGSAVYAYEIKYSTLYQAEQLAKAKRDLARETDAAAMLRAEWARVANPDRIEALADKYLPGQTLQLSQIVTASAVPDKVARGDEIGAKLDDPKLQDLNFKDLNIKDLKDPKLKDPKLKDPKLKDSGLAAPTQTPARAAGAAPARTGR